MKRIDTKTYFFLAIGIAVINSLSNETVSFLELAFTNFSIFALAAFSEHTPLLRSELRKRVLYERIDLIRPENHLELMADLRARTGLKMHRIELRQIDFLRDTVEIDVFYYPN